MRIYILGHDGKAIDYSAEVPAQEWRSAIIDTARSVVGKSTDAETDITVKELEALSGFMDAGGKAEIPRLYREWLGGTRQTIDPDAPGETVDLLDLIKRSCTAAFLFDDAILREFDRKASIANGFVKITFSEVECGWLEHDGMGRLRG